MTRTVRRTNVAPDRPEDASPRPYSDFAEHQNIVLLGDPGAGKTHLFREAAVAEAGGFVKGTAVPNTPPALFHGPPLFIEWPDEKRPWGRGRVHKQGLLH